MKNRLLLFAAVLVLMFSRTVPAQTSNFLVKKCNSCSFKDVEVTENSRLRFLWYKWENSHRLYLSETDSTGHVTIDFLDISKTLSTGENSLEYVHFSSRGKYIAVLSSYWTPYMIIYCTVGITDSTGAFFWRHDNIKYSRYTTDVSFLTDTTFVFTYILENSYQYHEYSHPVVILEKYKITETDTGTTVNKTDTMVVNDELPDHKYYFTEESRLVRYKNSDDFYVFWTDYKTGEGHQWGRKIKSNFTTDSQIFKLSLPDSIEYAEMQTNSSGFLYALWTSYAEGLWPVWYGKFTDKGVSAGGIKAFFDDVYFYNFDFCIDDKGNIYVVFINETDSKSDIFLQAYTTDGVRTGQVKVLSSGCELPFNFGPKIKIKNGLLFTTWTNKQVKSGPSHKTNIYCSIIPADNVTSVKEKPEQISKHKKCEIEIFPNPFNSNVTISFSTLQNAQAEIKIYNIIGRCIKTLTDKRYSAGVHRINWNGTDEYGLDAASGIYIVNINAGNMHIRKKIALVR